LHVFSYPSDYFYILICILSSLYLQFYRLPFSYSLLANYSRPCTSSLFLLLLHGILEPAMIWSTASRILQLVPSETGA